MMNLIDNATMAEKYPVLAYLKVKQEMESEENKRKSLEALKRILMGCQYDSYVTLIGSSTYLFSI